MEVVLLEDVVKLGRVGSVVDVKPGYARNYLIPRGKAKRATASNLRIINERREELNRLQAERLEAARVLGARLQELASLRICQQAGAGGRLFGSVPAQRVHSELSALGYELPKGCIQMPLNQIKQLGRYTITIALHPDVILDLELEVVSSSSELPGE